MATKILQWNCRAISTAQDMLVQHLSTNRYEVLALQSLSVRPRQLPQLPGFHYPPFRVHDKKGGGQTGHIRLSRSCCKARLPALAPVTRRVPTGHIRLSRSCCKAVLSLPSPRPQEGYQLATYVSRGLAAKQDSLPSPQPQEGYQLATTIQTQGQDIHILNCYNPTRTRDFSWLANIPNN